MYLILKKEFDFVYRKYYAVAYTIRGKTADLTVAQQTVIVGKPPKVIAKEARYLEYAAVYKHIKINLKFKLQGKVWSQKVHK